ncbi:hypothetical protein IL306_010383 [Fusarium sp. DS 682]|nr:hypothetical protein IL306_010383 [Fusarium sp. DS 682]
MPDTTNRDRLTQLPNELLIQIALNVLPHNGRQLVVSSRGNHYLGSYYRMMHNHQWFPWPIDRILTALRVITGEPDKMHADWLQTDREVLSGDLLRLSRACWTTRLIAESILARTQTFGIVNVPSSVAALAHPGTSSLFRKRDKVAVVLLQGKDGNAINTDPLLHFEDLLGGHCRIVEPIISAMSMCEKLREAHSTAGPTKELSFVHALAHDPHDPYRLIFRPDLDACYVLDMNDIFLWAVKSLAFMQKDSVPIKIAMRGTRGDCEVVALSVGVMTGHAVVVFRMWKPDLHSKEILVCTPFDTLSKFEWLSNEEWKSSAQGRLLGY